MSVITWSPPVQLGFSVAHFWTTTAVGDPITIFPNGEGAGFIFDATTDQVLRFSGGRCLDGPILSSIDLTFDAVRTGGATSFTHSVSVGVVPDSSPANYTSSLVPFERGEASLGTFSVTTLFPAESQITLSLPTDLIMAHVVGRADWNGKLAISLQVRQPADPADPGFIIMGTGSHVVVGAITDQSPFFSGLLGGPYGGPHRYVRDGRYAMPALPGELVRDGDQPGLFVRPFDQDPEDPPARYKPKRGEGTVRDKVPDI